MSRADLNTKERQELDRLLNLLERRFTKSTRLTRDASLSTIREAHACGDLDLMRCFRDFASGNDTPALIRLVAGALRCVHDGAIHSVMDRGHISRYERVHYAMLMVETDLNVGGMDIPNRNRMASLAVSEPALTGTVVELIRQRHILDADEMERLLADMADVSALGSGVL